MKKPFLNRIILWSFERFPPVQFITAFLTFAIVCIPVAIQPNLCRNLFLGTWIVFSVLIILRILDEHKDYESDLVAHPERLLQKKILSLLDLRKVALFFLTTSLVLVFVFYRKATVYTSLLGLIFWGFLMTKEFFVKKWLSERLFLYSISHLLISPALIYFCATLVGSENNKNIYLMMLTSFFSAFSYEVARKIKGTDEENINEMNYVNAYGIINPLILFVCVSVFALLASIQMVQLTNLNLIFYMIGFVYCIAAAILFYKKPVKKFRKLNEAAAATVGLIAFLVPLSKLFYA